jgi:hypothetical protein
MAEELPEIQETPDLADWLKVPSDVLLSLPPGTDLLEWLRENGGTDTLLYKRLLEDPDFENKLRKRRLASRSAPH